MIPDYPEPGMAQLMQTSGRDCINQTGGAMPLNPDELKSIVSQLKTELNVDVCSMYLLRDDATSLSLVATDGLNQRVLGSVLSLNQGLTGNVARNKKPLMVTNPSQHPDYFHLQGSDEEEYASYLGIPLVHDDQLLGVLTVQTIASKLFLLPDIQRMYSSRRSVIDLLKRIEGVSDSRNSKRLSA